jgi:hypothetical protein
MIQGVILFALIAGDVLVRYRIRIERRRPVATTPTTPTTTAAPTGP